MPATVESARKVGRGTATGEERPFVSPAEYAECEVRCFVAGRNQIKYPAFYNLVTRRLRVVKPTLDEELGALKPGTLEHTARTMQKSVSWNDLLWFSADTWAILKGRCPDVVLWHPIWKAASSGQVSTGKWFTGKEIQNLNMRWITIHPNGEDAKGQAVLVHDDGTHLTVVGGAGGALNQMVIQKPEGERTEETAAKQARKESLLEKKRKQREADPEGYAKLEAMRETLRAKEKERIGALDQALEAKLGHSVRNAEAFARALAERWAKQNMPNAAPEDLKAFSDKAAQAAVEDVKAAKDDLLNKILDQDAEQQMSGVGGGSEITVALGGKPVRISWKPEDKEAIAAHLASIVEARKKTNAVIRALSTGEHETITGIEKNISNMEPSEAEVQKYLQDRSMMRKKVKANVKFIEAANEASAQMQLRSQAQGAADGLNGLVHSVVGHGILSTEAAHTLGPENAARVAAAHLRELGVDTAEKAQQVKQRIIDSNYGAVTAALTNSADLRSLGRSAKSAVGDTLLIANAGKTTDEARSLAKAHGLADRDFQVRPNKAAGGFSLRIVGEGVEKAKAAGLTGKLENGVVSLAQARVVSMNATKQGRRALNVARGEMRAGAALGEFLAHDPIQAMKFAGGTSHIEANFTAKKLGLADGEFTIKKARGGFDIIVPAANIAKIAHPQKQKLAERGIEMDQIKEQVHEDYAARGATSYQNPALNEGIGLFEHQVYAAKAIDHFGRALLNMGMGSGKTLVYLASATKEIQDDPKWRGIITMPKSPRASVSKEIKTFLKPEWQKKFVVVKSATRLKAAIAAIDAGEANVIITSPEMMRDKADLLTAAHFGEKGSGFYGDEAHDLAVGQSEKGSQKALAVHKFAGSSTFVLGSGTLIEKDPGDLHSLADLVAPGMLGNKQEFAQEYSRLASQLGGGGTFTREKAAALSEELSPFTVSYHERPKGRKGEYIKLDERVRRSDIPDAVRPQIKAILHQFDLDRTSGDPERRSKAALQRDHRINNVLLGPEMMQKVIEDIQKETASTEPGPDGQPLPGRVAVWNNETSPTSPLGKFRAALSDQMKQKFVKITGAESDKQTADSARQINDLSNQMMGVILSNSANYGVNLQGVSHVMMLGFPWMPAKQRQIIARALRTGQQRDVVRATTYVANHLFHRLVERRTMKDRRNQIDLLAILGEKGITGEPPAAPPEPVAKAASAAPADGEERFSPDDRKKLEATLEALMSDESGVGATLARHWGTIVEVARGNEPPESEDDWATQGAARPAAAGAGGEAPVLAVPARLEKRLDTEEGRIQMQQDQDVTELADLHGKWSEEEKALAQEIAPYQKIAVGVVAGNTPLNQETAKAIIHWKNLLIRKRELMKAKRIAYPAVPSSRVPYPPGTGIG